MESKLNTSRTLTTLRKYLSHQKFKFVQKHPLNKSPSKNVPSFHTGSLRFLKPFSQSPNKFYDIPDSKSKKSVSFGYGTKTKFQKKQFIEPTRYKIHSSFDLTSLKKKLGPTFGISRKDFYKNKLDTKSQNLGPGLYHVEKIKKKNSFYMGLKLSQKDETVSPGPGAYDIVENQSILLRRNFSQLKIKAPQMRSRYFQKSLLQPYDNKVPGPGSCKIYLYLPDDLKDSKITVQVEKLKYTKPKLPQCPRFKVRQSDAPPPGQYSTFSEFGG